MENLAGEVEQLSLPGGKLALKVFKTVTIVQEKRSVVVEVWMGLFDPFLSSLLIFSVSSPVYTLAFFVTLSNATFVVLVRAVKIKCNLVAISVMFRRDVAEVSNMFETSATSQGQIAPDFHRKLKHGNVYIGKGKKKSHQKIARVNEALVEIAIFALIDVIQIVVKFGRKR